jgi:threonine dehydratase
MPVTLDDIRAASTRIRPWAKQTPVFTSHSLNVRAGRELFLKCENLQTGGSFKIRGATNFIRSIPAADLPRGVVAFSSGNHAQAVAIAAQAAGIPATVVMPTDAPQAKMQATRDRGARIVTYDRRTEDREAIGRALAAETGATLVPPFDHEWILAGQGTAALELLEQVPDLDALLVCCGGGGLLSGCAIAAKSLRPSLRIWGVEPALGNDTFLSLQQGQRVAVDSSATIADGLRTPKPGAITFPIVQRLAEGILLVSEDEIRESLRFFLERTKLVAEPSGVVALAAALHGQLPPEVRRAGITISGGNVDWGTLRQL